MIRMKQRPTKRLVVVGVLLLCVVLINALLAELSFLNSLLLAGAAVFAVFDWVLSRHARNLKVEVETAHNMALQRWHKAEVIVSNQSRMACFTDISLHASNSVELDAHYQTLTIDTKEKAKVTFQLCAHQRGNAEISGVEMRITSAFKLWQCQWFEPLNVALKVYPDFSRVTSNQSLNGVTNKPINGLTLTKKRGEGIEFHQLREFRQGDSVRQIDWQATSKRRKLISREYQEEQNQHVIVMLDASKTMNIETKQGTHFDQALNALLMLAHTVLKQGDWFSMQSFNQSIRWLPSVKGAQNVSRVMNHFYDLYPDQTCSDYTVAVNQLLLKRSKRSLVLMVTTLDEQNLDELLPALRLLQKHHLVALINISNRALTEVVEQPLETFNDATQYCAALSLLNDHKANLSRLRKQGVITIDCKPEHLLPYVINTYLNVKHSGAL